MEKDLVSADLILEYLKGMVERKIPISKEEWLNIAMKLSILGVDEAKLYNKMFRQVAEKKLAILKGQEKKNVAMADAEVEASEEYQFLKDQEVKLEAMKQFIMIAKKNSDTTY